MRLTEVSPASPAVLGYGYLRRTAALNLRDSGAKVRIGNREDAYAEQARVEGFEMVPLSTAAGGDVVYVLLPDEVIPKLFESEIASMLRPDSAIAFGSGYGLAFDLIRPPATVDVLLVAPRMAGPTARARYLEGQGFWACVGVEADRKRRPTSANPGPRSRRAGLESCPSIGKQEDRRSSPFTWRRR